MTEQIVRSSDRAGKSWTDRSDLGVVPAATLPGFSKQLREHGQRLLDQEFWFFGQDIRRTEGNLLEQYGFRKVRAPDGVQGSHTYSVLLADDAMLSLWGFGFSVWRRGAGRIFVPRIRLEPGFSPFGQELPAVWSSGQLGDLERPTDRDDWQAMAVLIVPVLHWFSVYEEWVLQVAGLGYREACFAGRKRPVGDPNSLPTLFTDLAYDCDKESAAFMGA